MIPFQYIRPAKQKSAIDAILKDKSAQFIAGGTNLVDLMKRGVTKPEKLVDITNLPLKEIALKNNKLYIGALALNSEVAEHPLVAKNYPLLAQALKAGASPQLRNMATVGGNMLQRTRCSYFYDTVMPCNKRNPGSGCGALKGYNRMHAIFGASEQCIAVHPSDMCVALAALDAVVLVSGSKGDRRVSFSGFHRLPGDRPDKDNVLERGDLVIGVELPAALYTKNAFYLKVRDRASYAFALISVAAGIEMQGSTIKSIRLAMGGVAHKPWRLTEAERFLVGKSATEENFIAAAAMAMKGATSYGENAFKLKLAPNSIVEALLTASRA